MIVALCGRKRAGKDTVASILIKSHGFTRIAFADRMRDALYALDPPVIQGSYKMIYLQKIVDSAGWEVAKEDFPEIRRLLQRFGTEMGRNVFGQDFWVDLTFSRLPDSADRIVITDCRFENEIAKVRSKGGVLWRVDRTDLLPEDPDDPLQQHPSEREWRATVPDAVLTNHGPETPFSDLEAQVDAALASVPAQGQLLLRTGKEGGDAMVAADVGLSPVGRVSEPEPSQHVWTDAWGWHESPL